MEPIGRPLGIATPTAAPRRRAARAGFAVPEQAAGAAGEIPAAVPLEALLAVQEEAAAGPVRAREARRRARALLAELTALQRDMLADAVSGARLARLRALAADLPVPADPALRAALEQAVLRARIELARFGGP